MKNICVCVLKFHSTSEPPSLLDDHGVKVRVSPDGILNCYRGTISPLETSKHRSSCPGGLD